MLRVKSMLILLLVHVTLTRGENACNTCASDTEYIPCDTNDTLPCSDFGEGYICVPDAPRDSLCLSPPPACTREGKFLFPGEKDDCDRYYECDSSLLATTKFCTDDQLFSELQQACVTADKSECNMISRTVNSEVTSNESPNTSTNLPSVSDVTSTTDDNNEITIENQVNSEAASIGNNEVTTENPVSSEASSLSTNRPLESTTNIAVSSTVNNELTTAQRETSTDGTDISTVTEDSSSSVTPTHTTLTTNIITSTERSTPGNRDTSEQDNSSESNEITKDDQTSTGNPTSETSTQISTTEATQRCSRFSRFPDTTDCHKFYICMWRPFFGYIKVSRTCPFNLVFDEVRNTCRFNADCGDRPK